MGIKATVNLRSETKPQYQVTFIGGDLVTISPNTVAVWVGDQVNSGIAVHGLQKCLQKMREMGWQDGPTYAAVQAGSSLVDYGTNLPVFEEDDLVVMQGAGFTEPFNSNSAHTKRLIELYLENAKNG